MAPLLPGIANPPSCPCPPVAVVLVFCWCPVTSQLAESRAWGSLCPDVGCVDSHTVVSLQEPRMFLRDEAHKSSPTECSPVHVVSPSPVSWVPEVHPSSEKTASEKRSPGTAFRPGWEKLFTGSKASEPPAEKKKPYCSWRSRLPECVKTDWCHTGLSSAIACSSELGLRPTWRRV